MRMKLLFVIAGLFTASPAFADWQYAKWGSTPDEVVAASGGKAQRIPNGATNTYADGRVQLVTGVHTAGSRTFIVKFAFRENRLADVQLALNYSAPAECYALEKDLISLYGEPLARSNGGSGDMLSRNWVDRANNNQIAFLFVTYSAKTCLVNYSPIQSAETEGL